VLRAPLRVYLAAIALRNAPLLPTITHIIHQPPKFGNRINGLHGAVKQDLRFVSTVSDCSVDIRALVMMPFSRSISGRGRAPVTMRREPK
jgi:hypothetical protein